MTTFDWRTLASEPAIHDCDCGYCDMGGEPEEKEWPALVKVTVNGADYVTDRMLALRADIAPVPDGYEGAVIKGPRDTDWETTFGESAEGLVFRASVLQVIESQGWRLRLLVTGGEVQGGRKVAVVDADDAHIGWAVSCRENDDYYSESFARRYEVTS